MCGQGCIFWSDHFYFKMERNFNLNIQEHLRVESFSCSVVYLHSGGNWFVSLAELPALLSDILRALHPFLQTDTGPTIIQ